MEMLARSVAAFRVATRLASASTIRCCSACLIEVRSNFRLPPVSTMRRAKQCRYFARSLPPRKRHSRLTAVRRGCKRSRIAGIHGEAMYTALTLRSACSYSSYRLPMSGGEGVPLILPLGFKRGHSLLEENVPFIRSPLRVSRRKLRSAARAADSPYLRKSRRQNDTTSCAGFDVVVMRSTYSTGPSPS